LQRKETTMPAFKVADLAWGRLQSPSLDEAEEFLVNFGMARVERTKDRLYMRGTDPAHHIHITHLGASKCLGVAFHVDDPDELKKAAKVSGATGIENIDEPGGGKRVRIKDPNGYEVEIIHGVEPLAPLPIHKNVLNWGSEKHRRTDHLMRLPHGPSQVKRIAHAVFMTPEAKNVVKWYRDTLGFLQSDDVYVGSPDNIIASFNRCDRGDNYVDHHVFLCIQGPKVGLNHLSFEVQTIRSRCRPSTT
jgi:catechol 2,3-dioxygenase-like lactoylglutathione lyase family enzyme